MSVIIVSLLFCLAVAVLSGYVEFFAVYGRGIIISLIGVMLMAAAVELYFYLNSDNVIDGDLVAGVDDGDGLVFRLDTPVEELIKKDRIHFNVIKEDKPHGTNCGA
jgi:hypothetical protein